jgi:hypothetical protein
MSLFERGTSKQMNSPDNAQRDGSARSRSNADAEDSAAHIAELVRRTAERHGRPGPPSVPGPAATVAQQPPVPTRPVGPPPAQPDAEPVAQPARPAIRRPSRRILVTAGGVAVALIAGVLALSHTFGSPSAPTSAALRNSAPAGYSVKVTDVITDCASHAHGQVKSSFDAQNCVRARRSLATGQVNARTVLFVESRIQMASAEAAASIKQVLDGNGTGNLNDLLREGKTFPGAPATMPASGYVSVQTGTVVWVVEAGFVDGGPSSDTDPALRAAAAQVVGLVSAQR